MLRDQLIFANFESLERGLLNKRKRVTHFALSTFVNIIFLFQALIGMVVDKRNFNLHFYSLNSFYSYGFLGRFVNGLFLSGFCWALSNTTVFFMTEWKGQLTLITSLKRMYSKLQNATEEETKSFISFLKIMLYVREIIIITICLPLVVFRGILGFIMAYNLQSLGFALAHIPFLPLWYLPQVYGSKLYFYV